MLAVTDPVLAKLVQYRSTSSLKMRSDRVKPDDENGARPSTRGAPNAYAKSSLCSVTASPIPLPTDAAVTQAHTDTVFTAAFGNLNILTGTVQHRQNEDKNSSGDAIANVKFYAVRPGSYRNSLK